MNDKLLELKDIDIYHKDAIIDELKEKASGMSRNNIDRIERLNEVILKENSMQDDISRIRKKIRSMSYFKMIKGFFA
jgi:uncharacterized protein (UPF0335 family)